MNHRTPKGSAKDCEGLMKIWQAVVLGLIGLVAAGCRSDPSVALLERDNNRKEMEIYRLKCRVEDLEEQLNAVSPAQPAATRPAAPGEVPAMQPAPAFTHPGPAHAEPALPDMPDLHVSPGVEAAPGEVPLKAPAGNGSERPMTRPDNSSQWRPRADRGEYVLTSGAEAIDNQAVMQITLHPLLTGGIGSGGAGDEGLLVVVEPRDMAGRILAAPGKTSVAPIDPALQGEQARLARWDFSAAETERLLHTGAEPGIHLRLPWRSTPAHDRLMVFVRYTTRDGKVLEAKRLIGVALNDVPPERLEPETTAACPQRPRWSPDR